jgi:hypothetical protein
VIVAPFAFGAVQVTVTCWLAAWVEEITGADGTVTGVVDDDVAGFEEPAAFIATTLNV